MQPSPVPTTFKNGGDETTSLGPVGPIDIGTDGVNLPVGHGAHMPFNLGGTRTILPVHPVATAPAFRKSSLLEGNLIRKVPPVYPSLARSARIQGSVVVYALISKAGTIENLQVLSGHPMLAGAAIEAIRQWRYRPYILNNEPIEVETQIIVTFSLAN
jgi:protein TonB